jgi:hypothetical protein
MKRKQKWMSFLILNRKNLQPPLTELSNRTVRKSDMSAVSEDLKSVFLSGCTRSMAWRKKQLLAMKRMIQENQDQVIFWWFRWPSVWFCSIADRDWHLSLADICFNLCFFSSPYNFSQIRDALYKDERFSPFLANSAEVDSMLAEINDLLENMDQWLKPKSVGVPLAMVLNIAAPIYSTGVRKSLYDSVHLFSIFLTLE